MEKPRKVLAAEGNTFQEVSEVVGQVTGLLLEVDIVKSAMADLRFCIEGLARFGVKKPDLRKLAVDWIKTGETYEGFWTHRILKDVDRVIANGYIPTFVGYIPEEVKLRLVTDYNPVIVEPQDLAEPEILLKHVVETWELPHSIDFSRTCPLCSEKLPIASSKCFTCGELICRKCLVYNAKDAKFFCKKCREGQHEEETRR